MDLVFMSTFDNQRMSIGCVCKLGQLFGFLRHYLLNAKDERMKNKSFYLILTIVSKEIKKSCDETMSKKRKNKNTENPVFFLVRDNFS